MVYITALGQSLCGNVTKRILERIDIVIPKYSNFTRRAFFFFLINIIIRISVPYVYTRISVEPRPSLHTPPSTRPHYQHQKEYIT